MKKQNILSSYTRMTAVLLCFSVLSLQGFAQNNAAQAQPVKKTNLPAAGIHNTQPAPWEKQPVQSTKSKPTNNIPQGQTQQPSNSPEKAQPVQH